MTRCFAHSRGLSPFHHPAIKYDAATALANLKASFFAAFEEPPKALSHSSSSLRRSESGGSGSLRNSGSNSTTESTSATTTTNPQCLSEARFSFDEWAAKMRRLERVLFLHATTCGADAAFDAVWAPLLLKLAKLLMTHESGVILIDEVFCLLFVFEMSIVVCLLLNALLVCVLTR
jgi:hypothetical protein